MSELSDWFKSIPLFTRSWLGLTVGLSLLAKVNLVNYLNLILHYKEVIYRFHVSN